MRYYLNVLMILLTFCSCKESVTDTPMDTKSKSPFKEVVIDFLHQDATSIRAIEVTEAGVMYAGSHGQYGIYKASTSKSKTTDTIIATSFKEANKGAVDFLGKQPSFRSIAATADAFFILSIENPALLYKYDLATDQMSLVYTEQNEKVFYDAMTFWNDQEGIAMGDPTEDCLSVIITRDGGNSWTKVPCTSLPAIVEGEAAFAASDTNVVVHGDHTWLVSGGKVSRVYHSADKGRTWSVAKTPIVQGSETQGAYTMDFYDQQQGIIYGGDYTQPEANKDNIAVTQDGGKSWELVASGANTGYKSCVQYVPSAGGLEIVAAGFNGIAYSGDAGKSWVAISDAPILSFRFANDSTAYAGGRNALTKLTFKR